MNNYQWDHHPAPPPYSQTPTTARSSQAPPPPYAYHPHLHLNHTAKFFGAPFYPSPLDQVRTGQRERAAQLGIQPLEMEASFEGNQSFPKASRPRHRPDPFPADVTMCNANRAPTHHKPEAFQGRNVKHLLPLSLTVGGDWQLDSFLCVCARVLGAPSVIDLGLLIY